MAIEYVLGTNLDDFRRELGEYEGKHDFHLNIFPDTLRIQDGELAFAHSIISMSNPNSPYRSEYNDVTGQLNVYYNMADGNCLGSLIKTVRFLLPEGTKKIVFYVEGGDVIDQRTGKTMDSLNQEEFLEHFLPNLKLRRKE